MTDRRLVRCQHTALQVPGQEGPAAVVQLRIHYPARYDGSDEQRLSGTLPVDSPPPDGFPVVVIVPGINVGPEAYGWLAVALPSVGTRR